MAIAVSRAAGWNLFGRFANLRLVNFVFVSKAHSTGYVIYWLKM
jgi:hypothetical protein